MELIIFIIGFSCLIGAICVGVVEVFLTVTDFEIEIEIEIEEEDIYNELIKKS